ncbi:MAG TPA: CBS domain-containing protein [Candidatus Paceibacterota bacterium]|nr:CBS domain-containing protein [Candidatus Paceibacterota bacterium]
MQKLFVKDIMTESPLTIGAEDSVIYAAELLNEHGFNGLPVVDENKKLVGLITEYDLIAGGKNLHLPTLINVLGNIDFYKKDSTLVKDDLKQLLVLKVKDLMNREPLTVPEEAPIMLLAQTFADHHRVNPILVTNRHQELVGIVSRYDLVRLFADRTAGKGVDPSRPEELEKRVGRFIDNFDGKFVLVSRSRAKFWLLASLLFAVVGFVIAYAIILNVQIK